MTYADTPAGPEMDALVATKVMAWHTTTEAGYYTDHTGHVRCIGDDADDDQIGFHPRTNIAHAFEVLAYLSSPACPHGSWLSMMYDQGGCWSIELECIRQPDPDARTVLDVGRTVAETLPLAICRAALMAVGK